MKETERFRWLRSRRLSSLCPFRSSTSRLTRTAGARRKGKGKRKSSDLISSIVTHLLLTDGNHFLTANSVSNHLVVLVRDNHSVWLWALRRLANGSSRRLQRDPLGCATLDNWLVATFR